MLEKEHQDDERTVADMSVFGVKREKPPKLKPKEMLRLALGGALAAVAVGGAFITLAALFILFCEQVWLK